jgi:hypothetical protein
MRKPFLRPIIDSGIRKYPRRRQEGLFFMGSIASSPVDRPFIDFVQII